jgi:glycosyltransferase involved in cell wall biosynthesis
MSQQAHQFLTALSYGDAIGDYTLEIQQILRKNRFQSEIFSEIVHPRMAKLVKPLHEYENYASDDALMLIHFSIGSELGNFIPHCKGKKLLIYHNITPHEWFVDINNHLAYQCLIGRKQLELLQAYCPISLADSEYNRQELENLGYRDTGVLPIRLHFENFNGDPDRLTTDEYDDNRTNIIVVGRTIPNKRLEDCIKAFAYYQKFRNPLSRLIFVGMWQGFESYYGSLRAMTNDLSVQNVVFTGHISFNELLAYYRMAHLLLTMSEHEGFCVPVLEAFYMKVPVLAWDACAIPYTAGKGAILVEQEKDYAMIGEMIHKICSCQDFRNKILESQQQQLKIYEDFPFETTLLKALEKLKLTTPIRTSDVLS